MRKLNKKKSDKKMSHVEQRTVMSSEDLFITEMGRMRVVTPRTQNEQAPTAIAVAKSCAFSVVRSAVCFGSVLSFAALVGVAEESPPKFVGSSSCAAAACHGGLAGNKVVGSEFPLWAARDPHARAYSALHSSLSKQMASRLRLSNKTAHERPNA